MLLFMTELFLNMKNKRHRDFSQLSNLKLVLIKDLNVRHRFGGFISRICQKWNLKACFISLYLFGNKNRYVFVTLE